MLAHARKAATHLAAFTIALTALACDLSGPRPYGRESQVTIATPRPQTWAVAPIINLSGQRNVDPLLQGDLVYQGLAQVNGITAIPVDRVVTVYASLGIDRVETPEQAAIVCSLLNCDGLLVTAVTAYDPYTPPKMGGTMTLFLKPGSYSLPNNVDPRDLIRQATPNTGTDATAGNRDITQASGMYDASNGYTREALLKYAHGRADPVGPYGTKEFLVDADKYAAFVYRQLTIRLLDTLHGKPPTGPSTQKSENFPPGGPAGPQPFPTNRR